MVALIHEYQVNHHAVSALQKQILMGGKREEIRLNQGVRAEWPRHVVAPQHLRPVQLSASRAKKVAYLTFVMEQPRARAC
jgi:hypothetical protein